MNLANHNKETFKQLKIPKQSYYYGKNDPEQVLFEKYLFKILTSLNLPFWTIKNFNFPGFIRLLNKKYFGIKLSSSYYKDMELDLLTKIKNNKKMTNIYYITFRRV